MEMKSLWTIGHEELERLKQQGGESVRLRRLINR